MSTFPKSMCFRCPTKLLTGVKVYQLLFIKSIDQHMDKNGKQTNNSKFMANIVSEEVERDFSPEHNSTDIQWQLIIYEKCKLVGIIFTTSVLSRNAIFSQKYISHCRMKNIPRVFCC